MSTRCRRLALALLSDTVNDLIGEGEANKNKNGEELSWLRDCAIKFVFSEDSDEDLSFWCAVAGVEKKDIRSRATQLLRSNYN